MEPKSRQKAAMTRGLGRGLSTLLGESGTRGKQSDGTVC